MKKHYLYRSTLAASLIATACFAGITKAADHADSPLLRSDEITVKQSDINDLYAFMNPEDAEEVVMIMTIFPDANTQSTFSTNLNYQFFVQNYDGGTPGDHLKITCTFPTTDQVSCSLGSITAAGALGTTIEPGNGLRVYTGLRDDPFFFNGPGLANSLDAGSPQFTDPQPENEGGLTNTFANMNILAIVLGIDRNLLTNNQEDPQLRIWTATESN